MLATLLPVLILLVIGRLTRTIGLMNDAGVENLKKLVTKLILPVAVFNALATAEYTTEMLIVVGIMLFMLLVSFALGFLMKPLMEERFRKLLPFMVTVYEGGLIAYPLFTSLCGSEHLSRIAIVDIAGLLFGFSIYMGLLQQVQTGEKASAKLLLLDAWKTPAFDATVLGLIAGLTGIIKSDPGIALGAATTTWGGVYVGTINMITAGMTAMILLAVGYNICLERRMIAVCLRTVALRVVLQAAMIGMVLFLARQFMPEMDSIWEAAFILYMAAPATFSMQAFMKTEEGSAYVSTTNSLYVIVSVCTYAVMVLIRG